MFKSLEICDRIKLKCNFILVIMTKTSTAPHCHKISFLCVYLTLLDYTKVLSIINSSWVWVNNIKKLHSIMEHIKSAQCLFNTIFFRIARIPSPSTIINLMRKQTQATKACIFSNTFLIEELICIIKIELPHYFLIFVVFFLWTVWILHSIQGIKSQRYFLSKKGCNPLPSFLQKYRLNKKKHCKVLTCSLTSLTHYIHHYIHYHTKRKYILK